LNLIPVRDVSAFASLSLPTRITIP
jgi:hypothetical protein